MTAVFSLGDLMTRQPEASIDAMARWGGDYDARCVERLSAYEQWGIADAKAGLPMLRTFGHLGTGYSSAEGTRYEKGYRSILSKAEEAEMLRQKRLF